VLNDSEGNEYSVLVAGRPVWELSQIFMTSWAWSPEENTLAKCQTLS
jgi:hypothetical protein